MARQKWEWAILVTGLVFAGCSASIDSDGYGGGDAVRTEALNALRSVATLGTEISSADLSVDVCPPERAWSCGKLKSMSSALLTQMRTYLEERQELLVSVGNSADVEWATEIQVDGEARTCRAPVQEGPGTIECDRDQVSVLRNPDRLRGLMYHELARMLGVSNDEEADAVGVILAYVVGTRGSTAPTSNTSDGSSLTPFPRPPSAVR